MDDRRKTIRELEDKRQENQESLNLMLADLGEALLVRVDGEGNAGAAEFAEGGSLGPSLIQYRLFLKEIAESAEIIARIEADTARLRELEDTIQRKEQQNSGHTKEISAAYIKLGEIILESSETGSFAAPYRQQAEGLVSKLQSLEERLESFEDKNSANVFAWISRSAQSMVIRSFLSKTQENLRRIHAAAGENFFLTRPEGSGEGEPGRIIGEIEKQRELSSELNTDLVRLRGERRKLGDSFGVEGSPVKQIQAQEKHIRHIREELRKTALSFGEKAADVQFQEHFEPLLCPEDRITLDRALEIRGIIAGIGDQIEKLKASLAIDDEKAEIERLDKTILEYRERIAAGERAITECEGRISEARAHIEELELFLKSE